MAYPSKKERNRELVLKRLKDPKKWSFGELGKHFNLTKPTVKEIYDRDLEKYGKELKGLSTSRDLQDVRS